MHGHRIEGIVDILDGVTSGDRARKDLEERWAIERWFTFPAMKRGCEQAASRMRDYGLADAQVELFPADGRAMAGSWRMPLAWDARSATLEIVEPATLAGRLLCDYRAVPCSLTMWSSPTPAQGVTAELVEVPDRQGSADFSRAEVKGKIVLTGLRANAVRNEAIQRGALGVLADHSRHTLDMPDAVDWMNSWSEDPQGWGLTAGERTIWGFNLSPRLGQEVRRLLRSGKVTLRARVDADLYAGEMPVATGVIPGVEDEEVLVLGHGAEQGANDNASGCAVILEALRALRAAIDAGRLRQPRRTIRGLITWEVYGTQAFVAAHAQRFARTVAGLCLDMVGEDQSITRGWTTIHRSPHAMLSFADAWAPALAQKVWGERQPGYRWNTAEFSMTDNVIADPTIGVPTPYIGATPASDRFWHTSEDTPDKVSTATLKMMATYTAAYLYYLATAGLDDARYLAALMDAQARSEIQSRTVSGIAELVAAPSAAEARSAASAATRNIQYLGEIHARAFRTLARLVTPADRGALDRLVSRHSEGLSRHAEEAARSLGSTLEELVGVRRWMLPAQEPPVVSGEDSEAARLVVRRTTIGSLCLDGVPPDGRKGLTVKRFDGPLHTLLRWCDGNRTLPEAARLARHESGQDLAGYLASVRTLEELGLVKVEKL